MKITSAKVITVYTIDYTFEEFIEAAKDETSKLGYPQAFKFENVDFFDMPEDRQRKVFEGFILHGDTYSAIARHFGFDGWKNAGFYNSRKGVRNMVVYRDGDDL